jgi:hypothetical protein
MLFALWVGLLIGAIVLQVAFWCHGGWLTIWFSHKDVMSCNSFVG